MNSLAEHNELRKILLAPAAARWMSKKKVKKHQATFMSVARGDLAVSRLAQEKKDRFANTNERLIEWNYMQLKFYSVLNVMARLWMQEMQCLSNGFFCRI